VFPITGTAVAALGMYLLSSLDESTGSGVAAGHMLVLGLGLGMVMQVLVLATQNAVSYDQLGAATSGATLFRSIGGSLGTAILGAIFTARLTADLPAGATREDPAYVPAFTAAMDDVFLVATFVVLGAFALTWLIPERPLRTTVETSTGESFGAPVDTDSVREIARCLARHVGRDRTLRFLTEAAVRAGVELSPGAVWLLLRANAPDTVAELRLLPRVDAARFDDALEELRDHGYVDDGDVTDAGRAVRDQLVAARTEMLREVLADWQPDRHPELDPLLRRLAVELAPAPH
jgi:hypothetical protein